MKKIIKVFGLGPSGSVISRRYAEAGYEVDAYEVRNHIAGNLFDYRDENGVLVHKYGPHIFQTSDDEVIEYVKKYSDWVEFRHQVDVVIEDKIVPLPINFKSIEILFENSEEIKGKLIEFFPGQSVTYIVDLINHEDKVINDFGKYVYKNVFENYTTKMWGIDPKDIDQSVLKRVPVRLSYDDGYFSDKFQAVPKNGYTNFISNILKHENINIELNTKSDYIKVKDGKVLINDEVCEEDVVYTGPIDKLFDYKYGEVPYRSLKFSFENVEHGDQDRPVVNYPSHPTMTRITDYRILSNQEYNKELSTTLGKEYPGMYDKNSMDYNEPYYPINNESNDGIIQKYLDEVNKIPNLKVIGRLAEYKYKQMWHTIKDALEFKI